MEDSFEDIDDEIFLNVDVEIENVKSKEKKSSQEVKKSSPDDSFDDISEDDDFLLTAVKTCDDDHHSTKSDEDSILFTQPRPYEKTPPTHKKKESTTKKRPSPVIDGNQHSKRIRFTQESVQEIKFSLDDEWFLTILTPPEGKVIVK
jgi:hypothetical protein